MTMLNCWELDSKDRPNFSKLVMDIESHLTEIAGYLDFNKLPHTSEDDDNDTENDQRSEIQEEMIAINFGTDTDDKQQHLESETTSLQT